MKYINQRGMTLTMLVAVIAIVFLMVSAALVASDNLTLLVGNTKTIEDALQVAEAGYNMYLWCLNDDSYFYKKGINTSLGFRPNAYYDVNDDPLWNGYPKSYETNTYSIGSKIIGYFQITVTPPTVQTPNITLTSVGWSAANPKVKRAIKISIFKRKFTNFVDFSGDMLDGGGGAVAWGTGEQIKGPLWTNGTLRTMGVPVFHDETTYVVGKHSYADTPNYLIPNQPQQKNALVFPSSNTTLKNWGKEQNGGYEYTGRTCILLNGSSGLKIRNKTTNNDQVVERNIPISGVIYVNGNVFISGVLDGKLTVLSENSIFICGKDPTEFVIANATNTGGLTYANENIPLTRNDTFANPSDDMLGLVAQGNVVIAGGSWPDTSASGTNSSAGTSMAISDIKIRAAMFGLASTSYYGVENYWALPNLGYIHLVGSKIASRMGATYTGWVQGYQEDNTFDYRMLFDSPPYFLEPANSGWEVKSWEEVKQ